MEKAAAKLVLSPNFENLGALVLALKDEIEVAQQAPGEIDKLSSLLTDLEEIFLNNAEERQFAKERVNNWVKDLKQVTSRAEDIIDEYTMKLRLLQLEDEQVEESTPVIVKKMCSPLLFLYSYVKRLRLGHKVAGVVKDINKEIEDILERASKLNLSEGVGMRAREHMTRRVPVPQIGPCLTEPKVYGRDSDKDYIINLLLSHGSCGVVDEGDLLSVVAVVGMGGIGKTTLAQSVYNEVEDHQFDPKIWISVSLTFDVTRMYQQIIEVLTRKNCEQSGIGSLQTELESLLSNKKFLLVMDDVWNEEPETWNNYVAPLRKCGALGSRILVTTRSKKVASTMRVMKPYILKVLQDDDCWSLFQQYAFGDGGEAKEFPKLVEIGKEIVKNYCKGLPLVAKSLGGIFFSRREESYWHDVNARLPGSSRQGIVSTLRLSYDQLPSHDLKQCFAYCSLFPKGSKIHVDGLIQQWMAHGFINSSEDQELENIGREYFEELLWKSFFQDVEIDEFGDMKSCKMHAYMHDLAKSITEDEYSINNDAVGARHLKTFSFPKSFQELQSLRTFSIVFYNAYGSVDFGPMFWSLKHLRVLDLSECSFITVQISDSIGNLIHLRFLKFGAMDEDQMFPNSICNLLNLQTLEAMVAPERLPRDISQLKRLRHLKFSSPYLRRSCTPPNLGQLKSLHTLSAFCVSEGEGCRLDELGDLEYLEGELEISELGKVRNSKEAREAKLISKLHLKKLNLSWPANDTPPEIAEQVLESLHPPNLKYLKIYKYPGNCFPSWLMGPKWQSNLVKLKLVAISGCEVLPPLLHFPSLEYLHLKGMTALKLLEFSMSECSRLKEIYLADVSKLDLVLQKDKGDRSFELQKLRLFKCDRLTSLSLVQSMCLEALEIKNCRNLSHLPITFSLRNLKLDGDCDVMFLNYIKSFISLRCLKLRSLDLECLPDGMLENHTLLEELEIYFCLHLANLGDLNNTPALKRLRILGCSNLKGLPQWLQNLTCLRALSLDGVGFTSLPEWLGNLTLLRSVDLRGWNPFISIPETLLGLPLQDIRICGHSMSNERLKQLTQHIPNVHFAHQAQASYSESEYIREKWVCIKDKVHAVRPGPASVIIKDKGNPVTQNWARGRWSVRL